MSDSNDKPARPSPRMTPDEVWQYVTDGHNGILTTLRRDGVPVALPLWYVCVDRAIYTSTRGKKLARVINDARSSFLVESGVHYGDLKGVHMTGVTELFEPDEEFAATLTAEMDRKYREHRLKSSAMPSAAAQTYATTMRWIRFTPDSRILNWSNPRMLGKE